MERGNLCRLTWMSPVKLFFLMYSSILNSDLSKLSSSWKYAIQNNTAGCYWGQPTWSGTACRVLASSECQPLSPGESRPFSSCSKTGARGGLCVHPCPSHLSSSLKVVWVVFLFFLPHSPAKCWSRALCVEGLLALWRAGLESVSQDTEIGNINTGRV